MPNQYVNKVVLDGVVKIDITDTTAEEGDVASGEVFYKASGERSVGTGMFVPVPIGAVLDFAGSTAPTGFLICDGSAVSRADYAELFDAIGTTWGSGDGSTTFNVPDFRGRTSIGAGTGTASDATAHALGSSDGTETHLHSTSTHKLTEAETPVHAHTHSMTQAKYKLAGHTHEMPNSFVVYRGSGLGNGLGTGTGGYGTNNGSGFTKLTSGGVSSQPVMSADTNATVTSRVYPSGESASTVTAHGHGNTGSKSTMQPFATVNKIIRAI